MVDLAYLLHEEFDKTVENTKFQIEKGSKQEVKLKLGNHSLGYYPVYRNNLKDIKIEKELKTNLIAPLRKEEQIGSIKLQIGEETIQEIAIVIKEDIKKKGIGDYLKELGNYLLKIPKLIVVQTAE